MELFWKYSRDPKSTPTKDYLCRISGVDQGNAEHLNNTVTYILVSIEFSHFILLIKDLVIIKNFSSQHKTYDCFDKIYNIF